MVNDFIPEKLLEMVNSQRKRERHYCRCLVIKPNGEEVTCRRLAVPDGPFCVPCKDRHPELSDGGGEVTAR